MVGIFRARGGTRTPANESAAIRKVITTIAAFTGELSCLWNFLATRRLPQLVCQKFAPNFGWWLNLKSRWGERPHEPPSQSDARPDKNPAVAGGVGFRFSCAYCTTPISAAEVHAPSLASESALSLMNRQFFAAKVTVFKSLLLSNSPLATGWPKLLPSLLT